MLCLGGRVSDEQEVSVPTLSWVSYYLGDPSSPTSSKLRGQHQLPLENTRRRPTNSACLPRGMVRRLGPPSHSLARGSTWALCPTGPSAQGPLREGSSPSTLWDQLYPFPSERETMGKLPPAASCNPPPPPNQVSAVVGGGGGGDSFLPPACSGRRNSSPSQTPWRSPGRKF